MNNRLRVSRPEELLSLIPYQLGFEPRESVVVVCLNGPRQQVGLVARINCDDLEGPQSADAARTLLSHCLANGGRRVVVVAYGKASGESNDALGTCAHAVNIVRQALEPHVEVYEQWIVHGGNYGRFAVNGVCVGNLPPRIESTLDSTAEVRTELHVASTALGLCDCHRGSTEDFTFTEVAARMVFEGVPRAQRREDIARIPAASEARIFDVQAVVAQKQKLNASARRGQAMHAWSEVLAVDEPLGTEMAGAILAGLGEIPFRDAVLISMTSLGMAHAERFMKMCASGNSAPEVDELARRAVAEITDPMHAKAPNRQHLDRIVAVLEQLVASATTEQSVAPRTLLALAAWWGGRGVVAHRHLEEVEKVDPHYGLAALITTALSHGIAAGWQRKR